MKSLLSEFSGRGERVGLRAVLNFFELSRFVDLGFQETSQAVEVAVGVDVAD